MKLKEKLPLIVGIVLPLLLILYVAVTAYLPSLFVKPKYNFVYASDSYYDFDISVIDGRVNIQPRYTDYANRTYAPKQPTLFLYDVTSDKSKQLSLPQAQGHILDSSNKSPDGFTVGRQDSDSYSYFPFFFGGSYNRGTYLMGKGLNRKITDQNYYNFKFIGWIVNE
ncbi:MAG TPA: hypothetical protein VIK81_02715 [Patescibacteria group bacterium]